MADTSSVSCPSAPASFTGPLSGQLQVAINIDASDSFNAFDISVKADPGVLQAINLELTGSLIREPRFIVSECINNSPVVGNCRPGIDGYGIVSLAVTALGYNVPAPATGRLFSISYNIGDGFFGITSNIGFQTGCTNTSNSSFCVTIFDAASSQVIPEDVQEASFTVADFFTTIEPSSRSIAKGSATTYTITVTSVGQYSGTVNLAATLSSSTKRAPAFSLTPSSVSLSPGSSITSFLTFTTTKSTSVGTYRIGVIATDGVLTRTTIATLTVSQR